MFDIAIKHFLSAPTRVESDSDVVKIAVFESALVKIPLHKASDSTSVKKVYEVPSEARQCFRRKTRGRAR